MLLPGSEFKLPQFPDILLFRDDADGSRFYAASARPRVARADDGSPEFGLTVYGKQNAGRFDPNGGFLTLTVSLGLTPDEQSALLDALAAMLAADAPPDAPPPRPTLTSPPWTGGQVMLEGSGGLAATAKPSLFGDNRGSMSVRLTPAQAEAATKGQLQLSVRYDARVDASASPLSLAAKLDLGHADLTAKTNRVTL